MSLLDAEVKIWRKVSPILVTSNAETVSDGVGFGSDNFNSFICTASFVGWQRLSFAGVLVSDPDIEVSASEGIAAESLVHLHLYDSQAIS